MITCKLIGPGAENNGLGNQMFCVAATASLAADNNDIAVYPQLNQPGSLPYLDNILSKLDNNNHDYSPFHELYKEKDIHTFTPIEYAQGMVLDGYWQSHKYFNHNRDLILDLFKTPDKYTQKIKNKYNFEGITVAVHIRRGDYVNIPHAHPLCSLDYYKTAIKEFENMDCTFMVFSDDLEWCKLNFPSSYVFVDEPDYICLYMMSMCDHNIIANSSFSWWGAWLNTNTDKVVIYPTQWFGEMYPGDISDRIPAKWIGVDN